MASGTNPPTAPTALEVLTQTITKTVLTTMQQKFDTNNSTLMDDVKSLLAETTPEITERATKRMRMDNPELTSPGNIDQYKHNADVLRQIEKAATCIMKGDGQAGISSLKEGKKLITQRQKLVRLADREEKGWKFVREYVKDNLAEDSDDEKQIRRARRTVQEKFPARRQPTTVQTQFSSQPAISTISRKLQLSPTRTTLATIIPIEQTAPNRLPPRQI